MSEYVMRPPGHITDVMRQMKQWKKARASKGLQSKTLSVGIKYLREYRELQHKHAALLKKAEEMEFWLENEHKKD